MDLLNKKVGKYSGFEKKKFPFIYAFIAFPVLQFLVFWVYVNFSSIMFAFLNKDNVLCFDHFVKVFQAFGGDTMHTHDAHLLETLFRSMFLWALDFVILFPIGVVTTYILYRRLKGHYIFRVCYIIPSLMGAVMWTQLIRYLVMNGGAVYNFVKLFGAELPGDGLFSSAETAFPTIVILKIVMGLVGNNAVLTGAFSRVPDEIYESAELDGAGFWRTFIQIAVPCVWSTIATLLTFSLCSFVTADYNIYLFTQGTGINGTATIGFLLYKITYEISKSEGVPYYGFPAALGLTLTVITVPVVLFGRRLIEKVFVDVEI